MNRLTFVFSLLAIMSHYYDYHIIGFLAVKISRYFLSGDDLYSSLLSTYAIMFTAIAAKPIGALFFGRISDIYGRQKVIQYSLLITSVLVLVVSVIPSFNQIGIMSSLLFLACRAGVVICVSPGTDSVRIYLYERMRNSPGFSVGISGSFNILGSMIASYSAWRFTSADMKPEAWRFAIALGGIFSMILNVMYYVFKDKLDSTNYVKDSKNYVLDSKMKFSEIIKSNFKIFFLSAIACGCFGAIYNFNFIFLSNYNSQVIGAVKNMQQYTTYGIFAYILGQLFFGYMSDFVSPLKIIITSIIACIFLYVLMIFDNYSSNYFMIYLAISFMLSGAVIPSIFSVMNNIPMSVRQRIFSLGHSFGSMTLSHSLPIICMILYKTSGYLHSPTMYMIVLMLALMICMIYFVRKHKVSTSC